ncbi:MAG: hypothetical protein OXN21_03900, partial [Chloroflexota bacterium]|nr:hypothetical protein [Chloroflexota bacterium]
YDQIAMASAISPEVMTTRQVTVEIEAEGPEAGVSRATPGGGPVALADKVDSDGLFALTGQWLGWEAA